MGEVGLYEAMSTLRAVRRLRPDPVPDDVLRRVIEAASWAPTGGNAQAWRFMLIDDASLKAQLGPLYRDCLGKLFDTIYKPPFEKAQADPEADESVQFMKMYRSANHLADHFENYPLLLVGFVMFDPSGSSIFPDTDTRRSRAANARIGSP